MDLEKRRKKKMGIKRFFKSIKYSIDGLAYAYHNEQSLIIHGVGTFLMFLLALILNVTFNQWAILIIASVSVMAIELLNTAIEAAVDLVTDKYHPLAKIAKDCGSAAGGVMGLMQAIIALVIFLPYIINLFK